MQSHGILSDDPAENPYFSSWNHVAVWYCSSDSHLGDAPAGASSANALVISMLCRRGVVYLYKLHVSLVVPQDAYHIVSADLDGKLWPWRGFGVVLGCAIACIQSVQKAGNRQHLGFAAASERVSHSSAALLPNLAEGLCCAAEGSALAAEGPATAPPARVSRASGCLAKHDVAQNASRAGAPQLQAQGVALPTHLICIDYACMRGHSRAYA